MSTNHRAFSRSIALFAAIRAILDFGGSALDQHLKVAALGEYRSRGKGGKFKRGKIFHVSSNLPHQGVRECARRVRNSHGDTPASTPRRLWAIVYEPSYELVKQFSTRA